MCGLVAFFGFSISAQKIRYCLERISHRGPDGSGIYVGDSFSCGHARLAVIDPSPQSDQPFWDETGRYCLVVNGEIYNHRELRGKLAEKGIRFSTSCDTEVLLKGLILFGEDWLSEINGMFAFVMWDSLLDEVLAGRDRFGVKPLYYTDEVGNGLMFASEMKAIVPLVRDRELSKELPRWFDNPFCYESTGSTIYEGIKQLEAGHIMRVYADKTHVKVRWWNLLQEIEVPPSSYSGQVDYFRELLIDAVRLRVQADVPVCSTVSGGLDSSSIFSIISMLAERGEVPLVSDYKGFVSSYGDEYLDEAKYASILDQTSRYSVTECAIDPRSSTWSLGECFRAVEDPYITLPLPMLEVYRAIRAEGYKVSVDGHGADELFSGYGDLFLLYGGSGSISKVKEIGAIENSLITGALSELSSQDVIKKMLIGSLKGRARYLRDLVFGYNQQKLNKFEMEVYKSFSPFTKRLYILFNLTVLPTLLRNYDRYSMANGIEVRMPFMDFRLVRYVFSLPDSAKVGGGYTKRILRDAMRSIVPREILERRDKIGWNAPLHKWLQTSYRAEVDNMLRCSKYNREAALRAWGKYERSSTNLSFTEAQKLWVRIQPSLWYVAMNEVPTYE